MLLDLQRFLFEKKPSRMDLLNYTAKKHENNYKVQVFRNHSFELVEHTIPAYLDFAEIGITFSYSGYDDSLSFLELDETADLIVLWVDANRYAVRPIQQFLEERINHLRTHYEKPVLVIPFGETITINQPGVYVWNIDHIQKEMGDSFIDQRAQEVSGTAISRKAMARISEELGLVVFPAVLQPSLKAIVVDLDNTIYSGVLGEDGYENLVLTDGHCNLQKKLKSLAKEGMFLCIASKNDIRDVEELFDKRKDFPLQKDDFTFIIASWESKASMIAELAKKLNIHPDSMLFIDDNIGELQTVVSVFPSIRVIHALDNAEITAYILDHYPRVHRLRATKEDAFRRQDVQANQKRQMLQQNMTPEEYIRSLELKLVFDFDNAAQLVRITELANKTNQFIFNYMRYSQAEVKERLDNPDYRIVSISLSDRLSESGLIGVCVGKNTTKEIEIEECYISCRALGRGIDDVIILGAIQGICDSFQKDMVRVQFQKGPRNTPAEKFVEEHLKDYLDTPKEFSYTTPKDLIDIQMITHEE